MGEYTEKPVKNLLILILSIWQSPSKEASFLDVATNTVHRCQVPRLPENFLKTWTQ